MPSAPSLSARSKRQPLPPSASTIGHLLTRLALVFSAISFIAATLIVQVQAHAAPLDLLTQAGGVAWGASAETGIGTIVGSILLVILGLLGVIFVVLLTYGGFLWLSSGGEEEKAKTGTRLITNSVIGLLIVVAAYSVAYFVLSRLGSAFVQ